ncbi:MAG: F0F1 ATP synthase subunit B' [Helicobacter sp.]|nr:F0F1 ATP synthase subunit B' [Helicobacter sp.]
MTELNLNFMILVFIVFLVTLYLLNIWVFRPLINFMDKRDEKINQDLQEIEDSSFQINEIEKEIDQILSLARSEAKNLVQNATNEAKAACEQKIIKHRQMLDLKLQESKLKIEADKIKLKEQILLNREIIDTAIKNKFANFKDIA